VAGIPERTGFPGPRAYRYPVGQEQGEQVENPVYHVLLEGRRVGPYDRRTIVGMRVKKTLDSKSVLVDADGATTTVGEVVRQGQPDSGFAASSQGAALAPSSSYSVIQGIHSAQLLEVEGKGLDVPAFKGEIEVRVQTRVLRISGRFREALVWKEDRVKIPLEDITHARLRGTVVDIWIRSAQPKAQRLSLDLLKPEAAGELAESLPHAAPYPGSEPLAGRSGSRGSVLPPFMWAVVVGFTVVIATLLVWALTRR
jgi:hypothetical protein